MVNRQKMGMNDFVMNTMELMITPPKKKGEVEFVLEDMLPVGTYYVCMVFDDRGPYELLKCAPEPIQVISTCLDDKFNVAEYGCFPRVFRNGTAMVYAASTIDARDSRGSPGSPRKKLWGTYFFTLILPAIRSHK